jgi:hypothetical protein
MELVGGQGMLLRAWVLCFRQLPSGSSSSSRPLACPHHQAAQDSNVRHRCGTSSALCRHLLHTLPQSAAGTSRGALEGVLCRGIAAAVRVSTFWPSRPRPRPRGSPGCACPGCPP